MANGWGGKRPGAGRPRGSKNGSSPTAKERLRHLECDAIECLIRLAKKAERLGDVSLAASYLRDARRRTGEFIARTKEEQPPGSVTP